MSGALISVKEGGFFIADAFAKTLDAGIKKMKYVHELKAPLKGPAKNHKKLLDKLFAKNPTIVKDPAAELPQCKYCKFWEEPKDGWGACRYVAKKGNAKGQKAYKNGWCQMFKPESKIDKLKKQIASS